MYKRYEIVMSQTRFCITHVQIVQHSVQYIHERQFPSLDHVKSTLARINNQKEGSLLEFSLYELEHIAHLVIKIT